MIARFWSNSAAVSWVGMGCFARGIRDAKSPPNTVAASPMGTAEELSRLYFTREWDFYIFR